MSEFTTFAGAENHALRILVLDGIRDFDVQVRNDPRMMDHIADSDMSLEDYRAIHDRIATKLLNNQDFDHRLFDGDETQFVVALAEDGAGTTSYRNTEAGQAARMRDEQIIGKAKQMGEEAKKASIESRHETANPPTPERTYSRATLEEAGKRLDAGDWDAHRKLAIIAVESGYAAEVEQDFNNDAADQQPLTHSIRILNPADVQSLEKDSAGLSTEFDAMGGTSEVEQFTPERPHGDYGPKTPFDIAPTDPEGPGNPFPSDAHLSALSAQPPHPQAHGTGPSLT
ncbi:hypothetical protein [Brevibacterium aurantiacum]|uniref:Uncharacterized protein n=1 Tax=Brevibacterium aurantiacum TaxID=273384 RepID=A0A556CN49_BREAU|nr:hypothetical protein [Brevibacterium aurantiacum]TSI18864.1 hypothetical protein FO013_04870 [Brevibacterium aurantiacum]